MSAFNESPRQIAEAARYWRGEFLRLSGPLDPDTRSAIEAGVDRFLDELSGDRVAALLREVSP